MKIGEMSWTDYEDESPKVALLPTGSTEQHGPHAPLSTDTLIAEKIAEEAAEKTSTLLLPSVGISVSREHSRFPGTLYLSPETFGKILEEVVLSTSESGVEKFVIVNGHGGNIPRIEEACQSLYHDHGILALEWTWFNAVSAKEMGHAGKLETSLIKYLKPELIGEPIKPGAKSWGESFHGSRIAYDTKNFTSNGVVGDPTKATREKGKELFEKSSKKLSELIFDLKNDNLEFSS